MKKLILRCLVLTIILITSCSCSDTISGMWKLWIAFQSSMEVSTVRTELLENRIELDVDYYEVDKFGVISIIDSGAIYEIPGISTDDIVCANRYPLYYHHELPIIYLNPNSEIKDPVLDLESKTLVVNGVEAPIAYSEVIKTAIKGDNIGYHHGEKTNFKIYLNDNNSFYFKGEIIRVEATEKYELRYYCSGCRDNNVGDIPYHLLEDLDGFYDWLDENVFNDTGKNIEDAVPAD